MSEMKRLSDRNRAIQEMLTSGEGLKTFYRFVANNPHIALHDACQIVIERPSASICFSFEEWNAQGRRVTKGRKGIPYYDNDGSKHFVFDVSDTHGDNRYRRSINPVKKILDGLDLVNGTEIAGSNRGDYRIMLSGVVNYLGQNEFFTEDEDRNRLIAEGATYLLYSTTGFPKDRGITLKGYPYGLSENADLFREILKTTEVLQQDINDAVANKQSEVPVIDDTEEETVTDEPVIPKSDETPVKTQEESSVTPFYRRYLQVQRDNPDSIVAYRMGDFYEIMGEKAEQAANILGLTLTGRNVGLPERVPMCGFPYHVTETYLEKLLVQSSVVVVEGENEPIKILSRAEALGQTDETKKPKPELIESDDDEPNPFDTEQELTDEEQPDYVGEIDTRFPITDDYGDEDDDPDEEDWNEAEESDYNGDEETVDYDYEEEKQAKKEEKSEKKGRPIWERRNKPSRQKSFFDELEPKTAEEELTEYILKGGSNVSGSKIRIYDEYQKNPYEQDFVRFLSKEYGVGGRGGPDGIDEMHDGKGIRFSKKNKETGETIAVSLKWEQAAVKIANLIDEDNYLNEEEAKEYATLVRFRNERKSANGDDELVKIMARQIVEYGTTHTYSEKYSDYPGFLDEGLIFFSQHTEEIIKEVEKYDEVISATNTNYPYLSISFKLPYCPVWQAREERIRQREEKVKDYVDRFTRQCADGYKPSNEKNVVLTVTADELPENEFLFLKDYRDEFSKYCLKQKGVENVDLSMQRIEITFDRRYIESLIAGNEQTPEERGRIRKIANGIISEGIRESTEGNYCAFFDELKEYEEFARIHRKEIAEELCRREEVSDVEMNDDGFDVNYYTQYLWNYKDEPESGEETTRKHEHQGTVTMFNRFKELTETDRVFAEEFFSKDMSQPYDSPWGEVQSCTVIKNGIYFVSTAGHGGIMIPQILAPHILSAEALSEGFIEQGYYCYEEDADKNVPLRELYDKGILKRNNDYFTSSYVNTDRPDMKGRYIQFNELTDEEKDKFYEDWDKILNESLAHWNTQYWQAHESVETNTTIVHDLDEEEDAEWDRRIESGELKPIENGNTDLTEIGFDQSELGGAKQRFRNNVEAIKLVNRLHRENRAATAEERKVLSGYVGWGGLAQAFDEHNTAWQKEYAELKNILTDEEYAAAKGSVLNAHYTSKEVIEGIYRALSRFGVKGNNRILEPAMGTGNFFGFMPKEISDGAHLYGVELDRITGRIATKLYPQARIQIKGFEETCFQDNSFDLMVTNVPFGGYGVFDPDYNKHHFLIHDYFIAKGIDKIKPNGLMAVITSKGTLDKLNPSVRKYIADRAELIGAVRLPNTAFKKTANTEVVTDILFFRKREEAINANVENTEWLSTGKTEEGFEVNKYYLKHPEMVLGTFAKETGLYGAEDVTVKPDGRELSEAISEAISRLPKDFYINPEYTEEADAKEEVEVDYDVKPMNLKAVNGKVYMRVGDRMVEQPLPPFPKDAYQRIADMIDLRKQLRYVLDIQVEGCSDEILEREQRKLNAQYDRFVKRFGNVNGKTNARLFKPDGDSALLFACENVSEDEETVTKADIFFKRTIRPYTAVTSTDDCFEALQISKNERGAVDISYIEELTKKDYDTVLSELGNAVFRNPVAVNPEDKYSGFETAEEYLSGRVVDKLQTAERYRQDFPDLIDYDKNVAALKEVQPAPIKASDIAVRIGTSWIDKEIYKEFFCQLIDMPYYMRDGIELYYNKHDSSWRVDRTTSYARNYRSMKITNVYGTSRANAYRLFEDCLNQRFTQIYDTVLDEDGREKRVLNQSETVAAREKQNKIKEAFKDWIFASPGRRDELEAIYNRLFNQIKLPKYDGGYLKFPEMNPAIELRPHQKDAVHRIITSGNALLHHIVGSGKTFTICAAAMKLRQYGLAKKPMIAVPNHLVQQWANQFRLLYPTAKLLIATKDDLDKDHREQFVSKVAMGDWDAVIIAQSSFAKINVSSERQIRKIQEEIESIERSIEMQWENSNAPSGSVKNLERIKKNREAQLKKLLDESKKDNVLIFEKLGVDYLFVDEADAYKNLFLFTKMNNVAGISNAASARASDLQLKIEYINELHGGDKGVVFATGTPISNSMTEMFTMQTYLQKQTLERLGINYFDAWAADFGETVTALELAPSGKGYRARTRFAKFTNLPELLTLYHSFADVKTDVKLEVPEAERKVVTIKPTDTVIELTEQIAERADRIYGGGVDPHIDNMLKVTGDGKKLALDPRCIDPMMADENDSKLNYCAENVFEEWQSSAEIKGTQLVFCDLSTPKKAYSDYEYGKDFDAYNDLKHKLVERGIPEEQIAFIHDANTDKQKQDLFDKVNAGTIRVLIGSTEKCGAGTNVQKRLVALHHLDAPYRPRDFTQRDGRGIRQGNMNKSVRIYTYATERTFDSYSYQILENKQRFISQIEKGDMTVREADDIDETTLSYAKIKAITSANPKIKRKMELDMEMARLRDLESRYKKELYALQDKIRKEFPEQIQRQELYLERVRKDIELIRANYKPDTLEINVGGTVYSESVENGKKNGGLALMDALFHNKTDTVVAEYCGFKISLNPLELLTNERSITLSGAGQYRMDIGESASGNLTRLENFVKEFAEREERAVKRLEATKADFEVAKEQVTVPFEHKEKIILLNEELSELNAELDLNKRDEVVIDDGEENEQAETSDNYTALPQTREQPTAPAKKIKKRRAKMTESLYRQYKQIENQNPESLVFSVKNGEYTCFGKTAEEIIVLSDMSPDYFKAENGEVKMLTISEKDFQDFANVLTDAGFKISLFDEPEEEKAFIDETDKVAEMQVDLLPDYTVTGEQMHEYGYTWDGMLPVRVRTARVLYAAGVELHKLNRNDTDSLVEDDKFEDTDSLYGVEKPDWEEFISSEKGKAYLTAWRSVVESAGVVINEEMSYVDAGYADPISDRFYEERKAIEKALHGELAPSEEAKPFIKPLLENYHKRFPLDLLYEHYGWDNDSVYTALAENISDPVLNEYAIDTVNDINFDEFMDEKLEEIHWLSRLGDEDDKFEDIVCDLKPEFEDSYFNKSDENYPYDEWYDDFAEEKLKPYLEEKLQKSGYKPINGILQEESQSYSERVRESVEKEFDEFKASVTAKPAEDIFYHNYEIHVKTELMETIESYDFDEEYLRALYEEVDHGGILQNLYDDFIGSEYASVNTGEDTVDFIRGYCDHYHSDVISEFFAKDNTVYFGKDEEDTAFYYFKDKLSVDTLARIQEQADEYIVAAPVCYMATDSLEEKNITFLKLERDIDEPELNLGVDAARFAMKAAYNRKLPLEATGINRNCRLDVEKGIGENFDGLHLNTDFIKDLFALYGEERMNYVLANTVQELDYDGRFSPDNKAWAKTFTVNNSKDDRRLFTVQSHPAVVDGFISSYRKYVKTFKEQSDKEDKEELDNQNTQDYTKVTARGDKVVNMKKDGNGREIAIIDRTERANKDFVVAIGYHTETGDWEQGRYGFDTLQKAEQWREAEYGAGKQNQNEIRYLKVRVATDALIKQYPTSSLFRMPTSREYAGYAYYIFNDKIKQSRQITDLRSDSRELCYELSVRPEQEIELRKKGDDEDRIVLTAEQFVKAVDGTANKDYETQGNTDKKWLNTSVPQEAFRKEYDNSVLFVMPNKKDFGGLSYFIPSGFIGEDKASNDGRILIRLPEDFTVKAQSRDGDRKEVFTAYDFNQICHYTTADDYKYQKFENAQEGGTSGEWNYVSVPEKSKIAEYEESTLFRMPDGEYQDFCYYIPNKCVKENAEKGTLRLSLHNDFTVRLANNKGEEKVTVELNAKEFVEAVKGKDASAYGAEYKKPSEEQKSAFAEREKTLRDCVPDEMKDRPNWVAVKTWWNEAKGRVEKRPINCNTGDYAESDNPATWTSFENALKYARENGATTVAYALDGKDKIACIDLDRCYREGEQPSAFVDEILSKCGKTYVELSLSGNGLHIFGKTEGMDLRSFSKDGDLEFYQKEHFIAMTGKGAGYSRLESFDRPEMKEILSRKCEKRTEWKGTGKGVSGLSTMSDKDVVEKASTAKNGEKFKALYSGVDLQNNHSNSDMSLMNLLAYWCNGDKEQMLRIFATSGLFRPNKSPDYYEGTAIKALRSMPVKSTYTPTIPKNTGGNGKR